MQDDFPGSMNFALSAALFEGGLAVLAASIGWAIGRPPLETFRFEWIAFGYSLLFTLPPMGLLWICLKIPWPPFTRIIQVLDNTFIPLFYQCRMIELAVIALLAGLGEEMLFRGIIQAWVTDKIGGFYGAGIGLAAAAVIFGILHYITPTYAILAGIIGLYLGAIWLVTGNLLVPVTTHALYDFLALVYFVQMHKPEKNVPQQSSEPTENQSK